METKPKFDFFVSAVTLVKNRNKEIAGELKSLSAQMAQDFVDYEILVIDLYSTDGTAAVIEKELKTTPNIRLLRLTYAANEEIAWSAALENAIGDFILMMDLGTDPPEEIPGLIDRCRSGSDIVIGTVKKLRVSLVYRLLAPFFRFLSRLATGFTMPKNATRFRCLSRRAVNAILSTGKFYQRLDYWMFHLGFQISVYEYRLKRFPPKKNLMNGAAKAKDLLIFSTVKPLRWASWVGLLSSMISFLFGGYAVLSKLLVKDVASGWTSTVLILSFFFFVLFSILSMLSEYFIRILDEINTSIPYNVISEQHSSVMLDKNRLNVLAATFTRSPTRCRAAVIAEPVITD